MYLGDRFLFLIGNEAYRRGWDCIGNLSWRVLFLRLARDKEQVKLRFEFYRVILDGRSSFVFSLRCRNLILFATFFPILLSLSFKSHFHLLREKLNLNVHLNKYKI